MITDKLIDGIIATQNPTCVGLDTLFDYLPDDMKAGAKTFEDVAERVLEFNKKLIDNIADVVPSVKVQIAYYEMYGVAGMNAYYETLKYAKEKGLKRVILTDHFWDENVPGASNWYKTYHKFTDLSKALPLPKDEEIEFLFGCETDMDKNGVIGISPERFDDFDFIIVSFAC